jgi:2-methylcitrate dehydratase PrpD
MTTIIDGIAERIGHIAYADLPSEAVRWAKTAILDTVGVTLAGAAEPCTQIVAGVLSIGAGAAGTGAASGECLIFGTDRRAAPLDAALPGRAAASGAVTARSGQQPARCRRGNDAVPNR